MLIVEGVFEVDPERRDEFLALRAESMQASRGEAGCLEYVFSADPLVPGRVVLFEKWESKDALRAHLERVRAQPAAEPTVPVLRSELVQHEVSVSGELGS